MIYIYIYHTLNLNISCNDTHVNMGLMQIRMVLQQYTTAVCPVIILDVAQQMVYHHVPYMANGGYRYTPYISDHAHKPMLCIISDDIDLVQHVKQWKVSSASNSLVALATSAWASSIFLMAESRRACAAATVETADDSLGTGCKACFFDSRLLPDLRLKPLKIKAICARAPHKKWLLALLRRLRGWGRGADAWYYMCLHDLLVGGWPTPLKSMKVSWDDSYPIYGK